MRHILVNTRGLQAPLTGTQRYTQELLIRWKDKVDTIAPGRGARGIAGHAWEQLVLPSKLSNRLLFCPSNTAPICVRDQVVTIHDLAVFDYPEAFNQRFAAWYQFLLPRMARRVKQVITVSEFIKERILFHTKIGADRIVVIPNGVSPKFRPEAISDFDAAASALALPSRDYVLVVGSLEPRKNLRRLFRAWDRMRHQAPNECWLVVVGDKGSTRVFSETRFERLPQRVFFTGRVDELHLPSLYAGAVAFAYVSLYEGFGLPIVEAMAAGTPVLAGKGSSLSELVGTAGLAVDPEDEEEIAAGILALVENSTLRQDLRQRGLLRAREFSWDETARRTWHVLESAADN